MAGMIKTAAICLAAGAACARLARHRAEKKLQGQKKETDKYYDDYQLLSHWMEMKHGRGNTADYFRAKGYKEIAIYGMGELANRLCEELRNTEIRVAYGVDRDVCNTISRMDKVYSPDDGLMAVDAIVVTPFYAMESIRKQLSVKVACPIVSLEEVVWSL